MSLGVKKRVQALEEAMVGEGTRCVLMYDSDTAPVCPQGKPLSGDLHECEVCPVTHKRQVFIQLPDGWEDDDES